MEVQVDKSIYNFSDYVKEERWCSYYNQIKEILESNAKEVILIGVGDGIVKEVVNIIAPSTRIITVDFDSELKPDICCDILELTKYFDNKVDLVVCCQVLEHIPYDYFFKALYEIKSILKDDGKLVLSLPDGGLEIAGNIKIPTFPVKKWGRRYCRFYKKDFVFNGEHYWEINGAKKYSLHKIKKDIMKYFIVNRNYSVKYNTYHHFFICKTIE